MPQFLDASSLWYLAAALPAITILYFLRLKRQETVISSTLLWKRSVHDLRVNAPIQMIRRNLLLLLQLLAITLIILALARPFTRTSESTGKRIAVILDCSASMATKDENGISRLAAAKAETLKLVDQIGTGKDGIQQLCVVLAADRPVALCPLTSDRERIRKAVEQVSIRQTETDMAAAIEMAISLTGTARETRQAKNKEAGEVYSRLSRTTVIILSDGAFAPVPQKLADRLAPYQEGKGSRFIRFGKTESNNLAIVAADVQPDPETGAGKLFVRVENMSKKVCTTGIDLLINGKFKNRKMVEVPPATPVTGQTNEEHDTEAKLLSVNPGRTGAVFDIPPGTRAEATVKITEPDSMPVDNEVQIMLSPPGQVKVLLVSEGNFFLEKALSADPSKIIYEKKSPMEFQNMEKHSNGDYDMLIFDRWSPPHTPMGACLYISCIPQLPGVKLKKNPVLYAPMIIDWKQSHPILRNLKMLEQLAILKTQNIEFSQDWAKLIDAQGLMLEKPEWISVPERVNNAPLKDTTLLGCLITERHRIAVLTFSIWDTQRWAMKISFPLFIKNTVRWLANPGGGSAPVYRTGQTLRAEFNQDLNQPQVISPNGKKHAPATSGTRNIYYSDTFRTGIYKIKNGDAEKKFAFSLLSSEESNNAAREVILLGEEKVESSGARKKVNRELWPMIVALALGLLLLEWYIYNRRILG